MPRGMSAKSKTEIMDYLKGLSDEVFLNIYKNFYNQKNVRMCELMWMARFGLVHAFETTETEAECFEKIRKIHLN